MGRKNGCANNIFVILHIRVFVGNPHEQNIPNRQHNEPVYIGPIQNIIKNGRNGHITKDIQFYLYRLFLFFRMYKSWPNIYIW